jgi:hypothetical protein
MNAARSERPCRERARITGDDDANVRHARDRVRDACVRHRFDDAGLHVRAIHLTALDHHRVALEVGRARQQRDREVVTGFALRSGGEHEALAGERERRARSARGRGA